MPRYTPKPLPLFIVTMSDDSTRRIVAKDQKRAITRANLWGAKQEVKCVAVNIQEVK